MKFSRLKIMKTALEEYFTPVAEKGVGNRAFVHPGFPNSIFMEYAEHGETFYTLLDETTYHSIKLFKWEGFNEYVVRADAHGTYLHRVVCENLEPGMIAHHKGDRFDNRSEMIEAVERRMHDQHRTYRGDLVLSVI